MKQKRWLMLIGVAAMVLMMISGIAQAQDKMASPAQAKELQKKVIAYVKEVGCDKAIAEFNNVNSPFNSTYKNTYIQAGAFDGVTLAHGRYPFLAGQNHLSVKDADGKEYVKTGLEILKKKGHGQLEYKWMDPKTKKVEIRTMIADVVNCGERGGLRFGIVYEGKM